MRLERIIIITLIVAFSIIFAWPNSNVVQAEPGGNYGPAEPTVVNGTFERQSAPVTLYYRFWSDGSVTKTRVDQSACANVVSTCTQLVVAPGVCPGDIDRDGMTERLSTVMLPVSSR